MSKCHLHVDISSKHVLQLTSKLSTPSSLHHWLLQLSSECAPDNWMALLRSERQQYIVIPRPESGHFNLLQPALVVLSNTTNSHIPSSSAVIRDAWVAFGSKS